MDKFEEYKLLCEYSQKQSERRQTTGQIYLTINTAIFGAVAFLVKDSGLQGWKLIGGLLPLFIFGILICSTWRNTLLRLEEILNWQYGQLRELEGKLPGSSKFFTKENEKFYSLAKGKNKVDQGEAKFNFSLLEARLPAILMAVYGLYGLGLLLITWFGGF